MAAVTPPLSPPFLMLVCSNYTTECGSTTNKYTVVTGFLRQTASSTNALQTITSAGSSLLFLGTSQTRPGQACPPLPAATVLIQKAATVPVGQHAGFEGRLTRVTSEPKASLLNAQGRRGCIELQQDTETIIYHAPSLTSRDEQLQ